MPLPPFAIFGLGTQELLLIVLIILLLFGARKIPDLARGLGRGMREFRNAANDVKDEIERESRETDRAANGEESGTQKKA